MANRFLENLAKALGKKPTKGAAALAMRALELAKKPSPIPLAFKSALPSPYAGQRLVTPQMSPAALIQPSQEELQARTAKQYPAMAGLRDIYIPRLAPKEQPKGFINEQISATTHLPLEALKFIGSLLPQGRPDFQVSARNPTLPEFLSGGKTTLDQNFVTPGTFSRLDAERKKQEAFLHQGDTPTLEEIQKAANTAEQRATIFEQTAPIAIGLLSGPKIVKGTEVAKGAQALSRTTNASPGTLERGFVTSAKEAVPAAGDRIAGQYIPRSTDKLAIRAKNLIKNDIHTAERMALEGTDDDAVATASELLKHYNLQAEKATDVAVKNALYDKAAKIANTIAPKLTETGRTIQAASILGRLTPEGQVKFAASTISKYNEGLRMSKQIPQLTGSQTKYIVQEMKAINGLDDGIEKAMRFQKLQSYMADLVPTPLFKKITTVWKAGLLTGFKTSGVNIFANTSHAASEVAKDIPATMVDKVTSLITGKRTKTFSLKGFGSGGMEGTKKGWRYLTTGFDERNIGTKLDYHHINFGKGPIAKGLQKYTDTVFRVLGTEDQPFYYAAKTRSLYEQAKVQAINKGLRGPQAQSYIDDLLKAPTDDMVKYAALDAETAVFQNRTALGNVARGIQKIPGGEVVIPFGRTPAAVATQIINYSPVGGVKTILQQFGKKGFDQRLFSQGLGRSITGTGVLGLGAWLMKKGLLTLSRPTTEREQKLWELEGKKENSIKIGGKWRQLQVLGPLGNMLTIGGHVQKNFSESGSPSEALAKTLAGATKSFTEQTFVRGVNNFIDAISDPERSAESVAGSTLASVVPTLVADLARATDTEERRAPEILDKVLARIPGLRETLEPQIDVLGQERETVGNPLEIMFDPTRPSSAEGTPVVRELRRLMNVGYSVSPTLLGEKEGYEGLTPEENTQLWKRAGQISNEKLTNLFKHPDYQTLDDEQKGKKVEDIVDKSKDAARLEVVLQLTQGLKGDALRAKLSELKASGLMTKTIFDQFMEIR